MNKANMAQLNINSKMFLPSFFAYVLFFAGVHNPSQIRKMFIDLLIHSVINPFLKNELDGLLISDCLTKFADQFGNFSHLEVGKLESYICNSKSFNKLQGKLSQTPGGKKMAQKWLKPTSVSPKLFEESQTWTCENAEARTGKWLAQSDQALPNKTFDEYTEKLRNHLSEFDSRYAFFLITCRLPASNCLSGISNVPWLRVFDFDCDSRDNGLLSTVEKLVKIKHNFTISTMNDSPQTLSERALNWLFPLGFKDLPDTLNNLSPYKWYCKNKVLLEQYCIEIANFCTCRYMPVFLILWYNAKKSETQCLDLLLSDLLPRFSSDTLLKKLVICTEDFNDQSPLHEIANKYELLDVVLSVPLNSLCSWLAQAEVSFISHDDGVKLPKAVTEDNSSKYVEISEELSWVQQYIEILPMSNLQEQKKDKSTVVGLEFVKGGVVMWTDLAQAKAVERDKQKSVYEKLKKDLLSHKKTIVSFKILHTPGGGGTTFARQILWYLHPELPCCVVIPQPTFSITPILERVNFLYEKCQLPIVLLVDGRSDYEVEQLYENCKYLVVILHVQRCSNLQRKMEHAYECLLPAFVSEEEGKKLVILHSEYVPDRKKDLQLLVSDLPYQPKHMFEFGLTAFNLEFKGVHAYVRGYLDLQSHGFDVMKNLKPWQKVVAYLSLVLCYSQGGLHKEVFRHLLKIDVSSFVSINDLGHCGQQFVFEMNRDWKINYYAVAKEVLEQALNGSSNSAIYRLSKNARVHLHKLVISFIEMLKYAMGRNNSEHVFQQLSNVILRRDYRELDFGDVSERRQSYSRLLEDVPEDENRIKILKTLTAAFPNHYEFHAHLGRMLNLMGKYDEAEISLNEALKLRINEKKSRGSEWPDNVRGRFHHMFGFACLRRAKHELNKAHKKKNMTKLDLSQIIHITRTAVYHFTEGRKYATYNRSYGYIGEVRVRLLIAEYVQKSSAYPNGCLEAFNGVLDQKNIQLSEFIKESHYVCDQLLAECRHYTSEAELRGVRDWDHLVQSFITCYRNVAETQTVWEKTEMTISIRRSQIASIKIKHCERGCRRTPCVDDIKDKQDAEKVLRYYEQSITEVLFKNVCSGPISYDVLEWLEVIRHKKLNKDYSLSEVLQTIEAWEKRNEIGYATYYLYVLYFLLAIYSPGKEVGLLYQGKADELKSKLRTNKIRLVNTRLTREWLACHEPLTIHKLIYRSKLGTWDKDTRFWKDPEAQLQLQVCTGIITKSSVKMKGVIKLDVSNPKITVDVSFYPAFYNLVGKRYADRSTPVEFFIGFSAEWGAEALSVKELKQQFCYYCKLNTKVITLNQVGCGICQKCEKPVLNS